MRVHGEHYRSIWYDHSESVVKIIDQRWLPHDFRVASLRTFDDFSNAISDMWVRGAPLIGATAAYAMAIAMQDDSSDQAIKTHSAALLQTRPTAVNLRWALDRCCEKLQSTAQLERSQLALELAHDIADADVKTNQQIGLHGFEIINQLAQKTTGPVRILTHCNAGWLATVDFGTATSPMYQAAEKQINIHVWVDETRPRNQGALTAWELQGQGISHQFVTDNAGGYLMQRGEVDVVIVGSDRTAANGDVCNKIGTYLKALAAFDNGVPFYAALPSSTIDWSEADGVNGIPIEERPAQEVSHVLGKNDQQEICLVQVTPDHSPVSNPAFDVTPARLVTGLITERGVCAASEAGIASLFPD